MIRSKLLAASAALLLGGCVTLGPDYREPDVEWLQNWQPDLYGMRGEGGTQGQDPRTWWRQFNDPSLDSLIELARTNSPGARLAGLRVLESRAALGIAGSTLYPQLQQIGADATYIEREQSNSTLDRDQSFTRYTADFTIGWELDFWGRFRRGIESADAAFFASLANQQDVQVLLSAQMADLYFEYCTTRQRIRIAQENARIQRRSFDITEKIFRQGQGSELDLQQAKTQYLATLSTIPGLEANLIGVRNAIAVLLGRPPGPLPELIDIPGELPLTDGESLDGVPANLLLRRPDVRVAAWQVAAQSAQIGVAEADFYPAISLFGSLGWSQSSLRDEGDSVSLFAGPSLSWNIFDYGRIRNNVRLQDARLQQTIEAFQNKVLQAAGEIDTAAVVAVKTYEQNAILHDSVIAAERSLALATTRYQEGYSGFQRVLDAQRVLFSQQERELVNRGAHLSAVVALYRALGGGWTAVGSVPELLPQTTRDTMEERINWSDLLEEALPAVPAPDPGQNNPDQP